MKIVVAGGSGHVGAILLRHFVALGDAVTVLSRSNFDHLGVESVRWDGETLGDWVDAISGADVVINLAGRSVNCRYNVQNLNEMMDSRVKSVKAIGQAVGAVDKPPMVWLQASTATIYAHRFNAANDEESGIIGGNEPGAAFTWKASIEIAKAWEAATNAFELPSTRKVLMRSAMTMSRDKGSVLDVLSSLARWGLGGTLGDGKQYVSWIHGSDFA